MVAAELQQALAQPWILKDSVSQGRLEFFGSVSVGLVMFSNDSLSAEELLKRCDTAMHSAKSKGRGQVRFFDMGTQAKVMERSKLLADLHQAVREEQLFVLYQPQIDHNNRIIGAEALVRWQHPEKGMISPASFIPLAEESGLIIPIGQFVFESVCRQLLSWQTNPHFSHLTLSVNVSAVQMRLADLPRKVRRILDKTPAHQLHIELTESALLEDTNEIIERMYRLKEMGLKFSLDDFGTGFSSLSYLRRLPIDQIKIDQSFIADLLKDTKNRAIARTILQLGENLGLSVLAEGVEEPPQRDYLIEQGCKAFQGYLFSRPIPVSELEEFTIRHNGMP